jgi:hypothetical protein
MTPFFAGSFTAEPPVGPVLSLPEKKIAQTGINNSVIREKTYTFVFDIY